MLKLFGKIFKTPYSVEPVTSHMLEAASINRVGTELSHEIKHRFKGSLAIREVDAGSDNAVEQELVALTNNFYDIERFGIHFVASPKHADMLFVTGPVANNMKEALLRAYACTPDPKIVVAVGDDAINGGIFKDSPATHGAVKNVIPVDYEIPGDPPSPLAIMTHLLAILRAR